MSTWTLSLPILIGPAACAETSAAARTETATSASPMVPIRMRTLLGGGSRGIPAAP
jgi:hypothetical protein